MDRGERGPARGLVGPRSLETLAEPEVVRNVAKKAARMDAVKRLNDAHAAAREAIAKTPSRPNQVRVSDYGSLSRNKAKMQVKEPEKLKSPEKVRDGPTCKERPKNNRGDGGSRAFVPWCGRRK